MFIIMLYFILQESLFIFNDNKERKPYSRYWFLTKNSSGCLWKCLEICWLFYSPFCFSFYLSYLCAITSNLTCPIAVILTNGSVFYFCHLSFIVCPGYQVLRKGIPNLPAWFKKIEDNIIKLQSESYISLIIHYWETWLLLIYDEFC